MAGGDVARPRKQASGRRRQQLPSLPLDVVLEISARSDPATLIRCAATCRDARRRLADDPAFRRRLRLRHADSFVLPLLRGHLMEGFSYNQKAYYNEALHLIDTTTANAAARPLTTEDGFPRPEGRPWRRHSPVASRDGLLLSYMVDQQYQELRVCDLATGRSQTLPSEPNFVEAARDHWEPYVLLVNDSNSIDQPFQVLATNLVFTDYRCCYLETQIFSSEVGTWGPYTQIRTPHLHGNRLKQLGSRPLVVDGVVHWFCLTDKANYILKLHISLVQVNVMELPMSFSRSRWKIECLLATTSPGGNLVVLVADGENISIWIQEKITSKWMQQPHVLIKNEASPYWNNAIGLMQREPSGTIEVQLDWFAERSGIVLISVSSYGFFWLDLRSMDIVKWHKPFPTLDKRFGCPYEMDLSSWVPTFSRAL